MPLILVFLAGPIALLVLLYLWEDIKLEIDALLIDDLGRVDYY